MNKRAKSFQVTQLKSVIMYALLVVVIIEGIVIFSNLNISGKTSNLEHYANIVQEKCSGKAFPPSCYDTEIPKLMDELTMEEAFAVTRLVQQDDPRYLYCHVLGHNLAEREVDKDPSKWKDVVARCPTTMCNNGCPHGALMSRFGDDVLSPAQIEQAKPDLMDVCEPRDDWNPAEVERSMCYHGLGHLFMYITEADIPKSLQLCQDIGRKDDGRDYVQTCTEATFMSVYQPLGPEDVALVSEISPTKDEVDMFCDPYTGEAFDACHRESWPLFLDELRDPQGLTRFCSYSSEHWDQVKCYAAVMNIMTIYLVIDQDFSTTELSAYCQALPLEHSSECFGNAARRLIQIDPLYTDVAFSICDAARLVDLSDGCYRLLSEFGSHTYHPGTQEFEDYCRRFEDPWQKQCFEGDGSV